MSYRDYVIAAYVVFGIVLLWDFVVPRLQIRAALQAAMRQASRTTTRTAVRADPMDLER
ncbi:MAG: heme exporter protein CcmD [Pseudomonadota bacterium]|nr:heme exporter protein CcmD [Pseudomonadota bacterium]MDQ3160496.1 heme exporter protein CcmD [Pseudomonadota bacterium]